MKRMKRVFHFAFAFLLIVSSCISVFSVSCPVVRAEKSYNQLISEKKSKENQLKNVKGELDRIASELSKLDKQTSSILVQKQKMDDEYLAIQSEINIYKDLILIYGDLLGEYETQIDTLESRIESGTMAFLALMKISQTYSTMEKLSYALSSKDFSEFVSRTTNTTDILDYDYELIQSITNDIADLEVKKSETEAVLNEYKSSYREQVILAAVCEVRIANATSLIFEAEADKEKLKELQAEEERTNAEISAMLVSLNKQIKEKEKVLFSGDMIWPLKTASCYISSSFGYRSDPFTGSTEYHNGIDIATYGSTPPVYAASAGKVILAKYYGGFGNCVIIEHGTSNGKTISTLYAHLTSYSVKIGDKVKLGEQIGKVGTTGRSTGMHLHFTVYSNGTAVNPLNYVKKP